MFFDSLFSLMQACPLRLRRLPPGKTGLRAAEDDWPCTGLSGVPAAAFSDFRVRRMAATIAKSGNPLMEF